MGHQHCQCQINVNAKTVVSSTVLCHGNIFPQCHSLVFFPLHRVPRSLSKSRIECSLNNSLYLFSTRHRCSRKKIDRDIKQVDSFPLWNTIFLQFYFSPNDISFYRCFKYTIFHNFFPKQDREEANEVPQNSSDGKLDGALNKNFP